MTQRTTISIRKPTKFQLDKLKLVPQESYENVIIRLIESYKKRVRPRNYQKIAKAENLTGREQARLNLSDDWEKDDIDE